MSLILPRVSQLVYESNRNTIWQSFGDESEIDGAEIISTTPFVIRKDDISYLLTSNNEDESIPAYDYVLLTTRRPHRRDFDANTVKIRRWLKHPSFVDLTPDQVVASWKNRFSFVKENQEENIKGLRPPQMGALHSILAHVQNADDKAIIVMPTGTGKTETMLSALIANECSKLLVTVPSDSLRTQISNKFITLGLLREFNILADESMNPIVGTLNSGFQTPEELNEFISKCNVVVSTMNILTDCSNEQKAILTGAFSHFFVDEAHHSEARTWKDLIEKFDKEKVFLFTATPFRNDGKSLQGKRIFDFSLRKAQEQRYYKQINYLPIREYNRKFADEKIADKAVEQLMADREAGYPHILMARCGSKKRAIEVFEYYEKYGEFNPVLVYTGIAGLKEKIEAIKRLEHSIIVCVNMLGEGFDLPSLKIAAIHDERQSLPITLQFVGRFTRESFNELGNASFITNVAYPPITEELDQLYARNADWNVILPRLSENATLKEINIREFLDKFQNLDNSQVPFGEINPALSTVIFKNSADEWKPSNWQAGFQSIEAFEHVFSDTNQTDTLVIILGKIDNVDWGNFETVQNLQWNIVIVHWDRREDVNRVFVNTSFKGFSYSSLMDAVFGEGKTTQISGMNVFRIFHDVHRLQLYNVGTRKGIGKDITFQSYFGQAVQDGIGEIEQGNLIKNNIFGVGYSGGESVSLGCSVKGKIWSYLRGNLHELTEWCKRIGDVVEDDTIDPNIVLQHTLAIEKISEPPDVMPILADWDPRMYEYAEERFQFDFNGDIFDMSDIELNIQGPGAEAHLRFSMDTEEHSALFELQLGTNAETQEKIFKIVKISEHDCIVSWGNRTAAITDFFQEFTPTISFADGSQLFQNRYVQLKLAPSTISLEHIISDEWAGVDIGRESQDIEPYIQDSIQYYFINKIRNDFQVIYDDDGKGEIADIIAINDSDDAIDVHLFHLKYAIGGQRGNNIENFRQVCGQAQRSLRWKHKAGRQFFDRLLKRKTKTIGGASCSRIIKGAEEDLENLLDQAKYTKPMSFHIYIVQPALRRSKASEDILSLLGTIHHYLATVGNVELKVYSSA